MCYNVMFLLLFIPGSVAGDQTCPDGSSMSDYAGNISVTNGGRTCQRWASNDPHAHRYTSSNFPNDDSVESLANYCRAIAGGKPFCLTLDPHVRGQNCEQQICGGATCGGLRAEPHGEIRSLDFDGNGLYDNRTDCLWTLIAPEDQRIVFEILSMDIEDDFACAYDFLEMYEMTPDRFFSHGRYCGVSLGDVTSGGPILYVRFYSDDYGVGAGFVANFSHINAASATTEKTTGDNYYQYPIGNVLCPNGVDMAMYSGTVNITNGGRVCQDWASIVPHWHQFNDDMFQVDGSRLEANNYCRNIADDPVPWCLTTDQSISYDYCQETICAGSPCGGTVTSPEGWLTAVDREPDGYFDLYRDCLWHLVAPKDQVVLVTVFYVFMELWIDPNCRFVSLSLYELPRDTRTVCENDTLPMLYTSEYNGLFVRFMSEINGPGPGFNLSYSFIPWENMWTRPTAMTYLDLDKTTPMDNANSDKTGPTTDGTTTETDTEKSTESKHTVETSRISEPTTQPAASTTSSGDNVDPVVVNLVSSTITVMFLELQLLVDLRLS